MQPTPFFKEESGQTLVVAALCMTTLIAFLGLAVDVGQLRYRRRQMQVAADAAAIAGALEISSCGGATACSALTAAAQNALAENGFARSTLLTNCGPAAGSGLMLTVNNPPRILSNDPNRGKSTSVEVMLSQSQPTIFARVVGVTSVQVQVRAEAGQGSGGTVVIVE
jgi:uncharacterized membrane protein